MSEELVVLYQDQIAGILTKTSGGKLTLRYNDAYRQAVGATPISTGISMGQPEHTGQQLRNWLWGLLPDNETVLARWARTFSVGKTCWSDCYYTHHKASNCRSCRTRS